MRIKGERHDAVIDGEAYFAPDLWMWRVELAEGDGRPVRANGNAVTRDLAEAAARHALDWCDKNADALKGSGGVS